MQCDQIGRFLRVLGNKISDKSGTDYCQLFGLSYVKTTVVTFWATFHNILDTFYFNRWSH